MHSHVLQIFSYAFKLHLKVLKKHLHAFKVYMISKNTLYIRMLNEIH